MDSDPSTTPALLTLPLELRLQIWTPLLTPPTPLLIRSLFIRTNYKSVFMSQQPKHLTTSLLLINRQITSETLPILYGAATWRAACRFEALASQIGIANFGLIRRMEVDIDDLEAVGGSLVVDWREARVRKGVGTVGSGELGRRDGLESMINSLVGGGGRVGEAGSVAAVDAAVEVDSRVCADMIAPWTFTQRRLRFANLEVLEVDGYEAYTLTSRGSRKAQLEGLRLCKFAKDILALHPGLAVLAQKEKASNGRGGSDAVDMTLGRVRWRFLRGVGDMAADEHLVDLDRLEDLLRCLVEMYEEERLGEMQRDLAARYLSGGRIVQYPHIQAGVAGT